MIARILDWCVPPTSCRWGRLTKCWPWGGPIDKSCPACGYWPGGVLCAALCGTEDRP